MFLTPVNIYRQVFLKRLFKCAHIFFEPNLLHPVGYLVLPVVLHHVEALVRNVGEVTLRHHVQAVDDGLQMSSVSLLHRISQ